MHKVNWMKTEWDQARFFSLVYRFAPVPHTVMPPSIDWFVHNTQLHRKVLQLMRMYCAL